MKIPKDPTALKSLELIWAERLRQKEQEEPIKIESYYQAQGKRIVDVLFDKGYFSDTLSRGGMDDVEGLLALYLQLEAEGAARCAAMTKKFKASQRQAEPWEGGEDPSRHEKEMRWIARAKEAEAKVKELEARLLTDGIKLGIIPEAEPAKPWGMPKGFRPGPIPGTLSCEEPDE
jgi:hypothetical protein